MFDLLKTFSAPMKKNKNLEKQKLEIIKWVTELNDDTALKRIEMLRQNSTQTDWWIEISNEEKSAIEKGLADVRAGRVKPNRAAKKLYEKWV